MNCKALKYFQLSVLLIALVQLISCTPQSCQEETQSLVKANFYQTGTGKLQAPDSITLYGLGRDSMIYYKALKIQTINIPLNPASDTSSFILKINGITHTLMFIYSSYPHLLSKECGFTFYQYLDTIFGVDFDYTNRNITTINEENIRIFY
jgi:hypothetical protein